MNYESNYLTHYGIPGQKWGVRRFQNEDGTLTETGKDRYHKMMDERHQKKYDKMLYRDQVKVKRKIDNGEDSNKAVDAIAKRRLIFDTVILAALWGHTIYLVNTTPLAKTMIRKMISIPLNKVATSKVFIKGKNILKHIQQRFNKNNIVLNKNSYKIYDPRMIANR